MVEVKLIGNITGRFESNDFKFAVLSIRRKSGTADNCYILDNSSTLKVGDVVRVSGEVVTKKFSRESKKLWYVIPTSIDTVFGGWKNELVADVVVVDEPKIRTTPLGKRIVEISLNCKENKCYLYAIAFNENAERLYSELKKGDHINITKGRLQSRWYGPETNQTMINEILINEMIKMD